MSWKVFVLKLGLLSLIAASAVLATDRLPVYKSAEETIPAYNVWDGYYKFVENHDIDVLIIGNSKVHYGLRPKILSTNLEANVFAIGSGGIRLGEVYYSMVEAFKSNVPKVAVVETYGAINFNHLRMNERVMSNQFKSFSARRDLSSKLLSTPSLFHPKNYFYAWSNTLRNHSQLYSAGPIDSTLINRPLLEKTEPYLGEAVRHIPAITDELLDRYKQEGPGFDIGRQLPSPSAIHYLEKIDKLCKKYGVELMFLTVPMYPDYLAGYDKRKNALAKALEKYQRPWLNLQQPFDSILYDASCFEAVYDHAQHLTRKGSVITSYKLAEAIKGIYGDLLPNRSSDSEWKKLFYGHEGYFECFAPAEDDPLNKVIARVSLEDQGWLEIIEIASEKQRIWLAKLEKKTAAVKPGLNDYLVLDIVYKNTEGAMLATELKMDQELLHRPLNHYLFRVEAPNWTDIEIMGASLANNSSLKP